MRVNQAVFGVFHHFELARELNRRGMLGTVYSTWPWRRLQREGLPHSQVRTFPWIHTSELLLRRAGMLPPWLEDAMGYRNALLFDDWTSTRATDCDALIALSGAALQTGQIVQKRGGVYICDRGSTHQRYQEQIVSEEYSRWKVSRPVSDPRDTLREEEIYAVADAITVPSSFARRSFQQMGVPAAKVHTIPYGVRLESFSKVAEASDETFDVLFAGSVSLRKGIPYLLQAFQKVKHPKKRLRIVGALSPEIKPVLERLPQEGVELLGSVPQAQLPQFMSQSHVLVLPSIEEGLALVQGQALACGCPVLATPNTGSEDLFTDEVEGFIVPVRDVDALTDRMQRIAEDRELQRRMSAAALARVKHIGGWTQYGDGWERLLRQLNGKQPASAGA